MKVLITGCYGQVGTELMGLAKNYGMHAVGVDHHRLDITDQKAVQQFVEQEQPDVMINAAAYTAVDKAERDAEGAFAVNATGVGYLAQACADMDIPLVHISTDYVFDGLKIGAYKEDDIVNPLGVYGKSKLAGEDAVKSICEKYYIFRTSWVFSEYGNNFVKTMLRLGAEREELGVVSDQRGKPTSAREIARVIFEVLISSKEAWGVYHLAQPDVVSWFDFSKSIFDVAKECGVPLKIKQVRALVTSDYPTPAKRPANSALDCKVLEITFSIKFEPYRKSLVEVIRHVKGV